MTCYQHTTKNQTSKFRAFWKTVCCDHFCFTAGLPQPVARGPHLFLRDWFPHEKAYLAFSGKKKPKPKPSFVWCSRNQFGFAAKTFFFFFFWSSLTFGDRYPKYWPKRAPILYNKLAIIWSLLLAKMHVARNNFSPVNVARTSKRLGSPVLQYISYLILQGSWFE